MSHNLSFCSCWMHRIIYINDLGFLNFRANIYLSSLTHPYVVLKDGLFMPWCSNVLFAKFTALLFTWCALTLEVWKFVYAQFSAQMNKSQDSIEYFPRSSKYFMCVNTGFHFIHTTTHLNQQDVEKLS